MSALVALALSPALLIAQGDAHYARRAEGAQGALASPGPIEQALFAYRAALAADPGAIGARWRLMRALYFRATFCGAPREQARAWREEARRVGEDGVETLERALGAPRGAARIEALRGREEASALYFWDAVSWGEWALARGTFSAARSGAAARIRDLAQTVVDVDPVFEEGGGYRILGRLHAQSPHIVLITGWVSREKAIEYLERAVAVRRDNTVTQLFLAEALLDHAPARAEEARRLLARCANAVPRPQYAVEDAHFAALARARLADLQKPR